jgi:hypothetical protein
MATEVKKIIVRKGLNSQLPDLDEGEPAFTTDTNQFFVGTTTSSNVELSKVGHTHAISNVTNLQTSLDGKAASSHSHAISDVTNLQTTLDGKATPSDITTAINNLVASAPGTLDTLNELAEALGDDADFAGTITTALTGKANLASPTFTGTVGGITKAMVGLGNVDNTTDAAKPISNATASALISKADLAGATFAGAAYAPTAIAGTNTTQIATTAFVSTAIVNKVNTTDSRLSDARTPIAHTHNLALDKILLATRTTLGVTSFTVADLDQFQEIEVVYTNETVVDNGNQEFAYINAATVAKCERSLISRTFTDNAPFAGSDTFINSLQLVITGGTNATVGVIQLRQDNEQGTSMSFRTYGTIPASGNTVKIYGIVMLNN